MTLLFNGDFDKYNFWKWAREMCCSHSGNVVDTPTKNNKKSFRIILKKFDPDVNESKRAEMAYGSHKDAIGSVRWYGFSIYLPTDWKYDVMREILIQWHATPDRWRDGKYEDWRSPPLSLQIKKDNWEISNIWDENPVTLNNKGNKETIWTGKYETGIWTDWVVHTKWWYNNNGLIEIWKNGEKVVTKTGPICYNDWHGIYWKFGIYKWGWDNPDDESYCTERTAYYNSLKIGDHNSNYNEVAPESTGQTHNITFLSEPPNAVIHKIS